MNAVCFLPGNSPGLNFICRHFGTLCLFHLHGQVGVKNYILHNYLPMKMEQSECSEMSAYKIQTRGITRKEAYNKEILNKLQFSPYSTVVTNKNKMILEVILQFKYLSFNVNTGIILP